MSIGSLSIAKTAPSGRPSFHVRPRVWVLLAVIVAVVAATLYVMATDHTGLSRAGYHPFSTPDPRYVVSGFAVGALVGLTGVGGGSLMTPLLVLLFRFHPGTAVGTDLLYASATKRSAQRSTVRTGRSTGRSSAAWRSAVCQRRSSACTFSISSVCTV